MKILFIADIVGKPGRQALNHLLPRLMELHSLDLVIVNGENSAGGFGMSGEVAKELFTYGIDCITMGNHVWDRKEIIPLLSSEPRVVRPANLPLDNPGRGTYIGEKKGIRYAVMNLLGRVYMNSADCPFRTADRELAQLDEDIRIRIVDIHGEATSEKLALGHYLDGRVSAVLGTHTHIATDDLRILPGGTAYITDAGMTGPIDSIIGMNKNLIMQKFLSQMPVRYEVAAGAAQLEAVLLDISQEGRATSVHKVREIFPA